MAMERQTSWGGLVAVYMFLAGTGAGLYTTSFLLGFISNLKWLAVTGMALGPILVALGLLCLLLEAGKPLQSYRIFVGLPTSWLSRGGLIQTLFIIVALGYALPSFWLAGWLDSGVGIALEGAALVLALAIAIYHGIVLTESRAIPLWSSSVQPMLSFFTALGTGLGLLLLISPAYVGLYGITEVAGAAGKLGIVGIAFIIGELISVWTLIGTHSSAIYIESTRRLRTPIMASVICLFWALLLLLGLLFGGATYFTWSAPIAGLLLLAGGFITRYSILKGGYYLPLRLPA